MSKRKFTKQALKISDLITLMRDNGLLIQDEPYAERCLEYQGYYRLKIYMRSFQDANKKFHAGSTFEEIVELYDFDRKLRLLCLDAIERIEVALRSQLINVMGAHGGPHFYYEEKYFSSKEAVTKIRRLGETGKHLSITHYKKEYNEPYLPAIWNLTEASTFGLLSTVFADLEKPYRKEIALKFNFDEVVCVSWFKSIATLRNICAHHGRLWNTEMLVNAPKKASRYSSDLMDNSRCYSRLVLLRGILKEIAPNGGHGWLPNLIELIDTRPVSADIAAMGFPADWKQRPLWTP